MNYNGLRQCRIHGVRNRERAVSRLRGACTDDQLPSDPPEQKESDDLASPMADRNRQYAGSAGEVRVIGRDQGNLGAVISSTTDLSEQVILPSLGVLSNHDPDRPPDP
jgi:hypothetical protein